MAAPTIRFRSIPIATAETAVDTAAERKGAIGGSSVISTGVGNELNMGDIDISAGAADGVVKMLLIDWTADGGNTLVENFKLWLSSEGFDQAGTITKFQPLSGADQVSPSLTENYIEDAVIGDYTWDTLPTSEPGAINIYPSDEGSSMALSTTSDDCMMVGLYIHVAASETTGTYKGTVSGYEYQGSIKYSYS